MPESRESSCIRAWLEYGPYSTAVDNCCKVGATALQCGNACNKMLGRENSFVPKNILKPVPYHVFFKELDDVLPKTDAVPNVPPWRFLYRPYPPGDVRRSASTSPACCRNRRCRLSGAVRSRCRFEPSYPALFPAANRQPGCERNLRLQTQKRRGTRDSSALRHGTSRQRRATHAPRRSPPRNRREAARSGLRALHHAPRNGRDAAAGRFDRRLGKCSQASPAFHLGRRRSRHRRQAFCFSAPRFPHVFPRHAGLRRAGASRGG